MTVLVLGGRGFIGRATTMALVASGRRVRSFDRHATPQVPATGGVDFRVGDLADAQGLAAAMTDARAVVHLASPSSPARSEADWEADVQAQVQNTLRVIAAMEAAGVRRLVFISSGGTVYGGKHRSPIDEEQPATPICVYGINKLAAERFILHAHGLGRIDATILRVANAYGPAQSVDRAQGIVGICIARALSGEPLRLWGDGRAVRDFVHVDDIGRAVTAAVDYTGPHTTFNIGSGVGRSVLDVIATIEALCGQRIAVEHLPERGLDVAYNVLDCARARRELAWQSATSFEAGLASTLAWYRQHRS